ncbi:hypothetical protein GH714_006697 [Hevea brasiliensis]|uniref:Uncharacterized protein n=1 Tax=Hevea brasiliensis TaxID=3981 RepID=A0A6A6LVR2_HEVBR|nr:hypothetical protein GH714_006697 [Hevea brasiliensis]
MQVGRRCLRFLGKKWHGLYFRKIERVVFKVAAMGTVSGNLSNPLLVVPFKLATGTKLSSVQQSTESGCQNNLGGTGYKAYVLEKFQKTGLAVVGLSDPICLKLRAWTGPQGPPGFVELQSWLDWANFRF